MSESSAVSPESVNKNTPESPKNKVKKKKSLWKILLAIILILVVLGCLLLCGVRAYFRLSVREYYKNSEKTFEIPGLSEGLIPQGLCYDENTKEFLVTGYRSDNQPSQISVVGKESGEEVKRVGLLDRDGKEYCGHVGGISLKGNYLYVAGSEGLLVYSYKDLKAAASGETIQALGIFSTATEDDKLGVAFTHVEGSYIYVGEFYRESNYPTPDSHKYTTAAGDGNTALILAYRLDENEEFGIAPSVERAYSIPGLVQGMCFDEEGRFCLSTSYGPAFSHIYIYNEPKQEGEITVLGQQVPLFVLDSSVLKTDLKIAPMSEEIVTVEGKLYVMCESASNKYIFGKFTSAKYCYATDLSAYG